MRWRVLFLAFLLAGGFIWITSKTNSPLGRMLKPVTEAGKLWHDPDPAYTAGLSTDELNNIEIYKRARVATVNITSTVFRRDLFFAIYPSQGQGSGFIITEDGLILTNAHVLQGSSSRIQVTLPNHEVYDARLLARDPRNDLGLIKISPRKKLPVLRLGDSDHIQVGQKVLAIGNPFGLEGTLTTGIVSSLGRTIQADERGTRLEGMIQTDAAINPGNSGGPLLDSQGTVIGINTAIYGPGANIGIGFALPINRAKVMLEEFQRGRSFRRPRLGVSVVYVAGDLAQALDLPPEGGLLIQEVVPGSAAAEAGLRGPRRFIIVGNYEIGIGGDLIMGIDGEPADRPDAITRALSRKRPGDKVELTIYRAGRTMRVTVILGEDPEED